MMLSPKIEKFVSEQIGIAIERKQTENELRQSEIQYRTTLNSIQDAWQISLMLGSGVGIILVLRWFWWRFYQVWDLWTRKID